MGPLRVVGGQGVGDMQQGEGVQGIAPFWQRKEGWRVDLGRRGRSTRGEEKLGGEESRDALARNVTQVYN